MYLPFYYLQYQQHPNIISSKTIERGRGSLFVQIIQLWNITNWHEICQKFTRRDLQAKNLIHQKPISTARQQTIVSQTDSWPVSRIIKEIADRQTKQTNLKIRGVNEMGKKMLSNIKNDFNQVQRNALEKDFTSQVCLVFLMPLPLPHR